MGKLSCCTCGPTSTCAEVRRTAPAHFKPEKRARTTKCAARFFPIGGAVQLAQFAELMPPLDLRQPFGASRQRF